MNQELFEILDSKVNELVEKYTALREENSRITQENQQLLDEREGLKARVDAILGKLEGI
ncbi:MAG: cell division protein ZapB [Desulfuromonadaceae bacterium GWB2_53_15]|nr:MAG: cell division protein ZapB [Desulfuromonadales bacterium GWD2_54_10]OHB24905.1 MAG: cell division protein ZapB [Desulfuromonadaceae bacterium GWB2_53_15]